MSNAVDRVFPSQCLKANSSIQRWQFWRECRLFSQSISGFQLRVIRDAKLPFPARLCAILYPNCIGPRVFQFPRVKSGNSTGRLRFPTETSVSAVITLEVTES